MRTETAREKYKNWKRRKINRKKALRKLKNKSEKKYQKYIQEKALDLKAFGRFKNVPNEMFYLKDAQIVIISDKDDHEKMKVYQKYFPEAEILWT